MSARKGSKNPVFGVGLNHLSRGGAGLYHPFGMGNDKPTAKKAKAVYGDLMAGGDLKKVAHAHSMTALSANAIWSKKQGVGWPSTKF